MNKNNDQGILPQLDDFLLSLQTNNYSQETIYNYERDIRVFQDFLKESQKKFEKIDKKTILNYKAYLLSIDRKTAEKELGQKKLSSFSVNRMLSALRSYLKYLNDMDYSLPLSPTAIKLLKNPRVNPKSPDLEDVVKLLEFPSKIERNRKVALRNRAILELLISTGMRISELTNCKITDLDKRGRIFVRGKGKKERFVYLTPRAKRHLDKYLEIRGNIDSPYFFVPFQGKNKKKKEKKISNSYIQRKIKEYREMLEINVPLSAHSLRHAFATFLAENGANPVAIQTLLGHESLDTTTRYVNPSDRYAEKTHHEFHPFKE